MAKSIISPSSGVISTPLDGPSDRLRQGAAAEGLDAAIPFSQWPALNGYLRAAENAAEDCGRLARLLSMPRILLEIGCGDGRVARQIALKNPDLAVIATDAYEWDGPADGGSQYRRVALAWCGRQLAVQQEMPANLVLLRAQVEILPYLPAACLDHLLLIHPEPQTARSILDRLAQENFYRALKAGARQIVVVPFCREMGVFACGGFEFEHDADWSRGLGVLTASRFVFTRAERVQWGVDLPRTSLYTGGSTQTDVFVAGTLRGGQPRP